MKIKNCEREKERLLKLLWPLALFSSLFVICLLLSQLCRLCSVEEDNFLSLLQIRPIGLFQFRITSEFMDHRHSVGLLGRVISSSQGLYLYSLYLYRTTQQRQMRKNIHALSGIRTCDPVYERSRPAPQTARSPDRQEDNGTNMLRPLEPTDRLLRNLVLTSYRHWLPDLLTSLPSTVATWQLVNL
jgi:hypothetical protein